MSKLTEVRDKKAKEVGIKDQWEWRPILEDRYKQGFDAAMELQLPVLFIKWINNTQHSFDSVEGWKEVETGEWRNDQELYDYWIENIYPLTK